MTAATIQHMNQFLQRIGLLAAMLLSALTTFASNHYDIEVDGIRYAIVSEEAKVVKVVGYDKDLNLSRVIVPEKLKYGATEYFVNQIERFAFSQCRSLTEVTIPESITTISECAFEQCSSLVSVNLPNTITKIDKEAFLGCSSLVSIKIPSSVRFFGKGAFERCTSLLSFEIPNGIISVGDFIFDGCTSLSSVTIPNSVTYIGDYAFRDCTSLPYIDIPNNVTSIGDRSFENCSSLTSMTISNLVRHIGFEAFSGCSSLREINVDDTNSVYSSIEGVLFSKDQTKLLVFPGGKGEHYEIPNSVTSIDGGAFWRCSSLKSLTFPNSMTEIGMSVIMYCTSLTSVKIPSSITSIDLWQAFEGCPSISEINVDDNNSVYSSIDGVLFSKDKKEIFLFPKGKGGHYFIPSSVTSICWRAFSDCSSLTSIIIPNSVTSIGISAFSDCSSLSSITIPDMVTSIGEDAFNNCTSLKEVNCLWKEKPVKCNPFFPSIVLDKATLYVPVGTKYKYKEVFPWGDFLNIQEKDFSGVDAVISDDVDIKVIDGSIYVSGNAPACVYDMQGRMVYSGKPTRIDGLHSGLYIVICGDKSVKVMVP